MLVVSSDKEAKHVTEAWGISVEMQHDKETNREEMHFAIDRDTGRSVGKSRPKSTTALKGQTRKMTKKDVRRIAQIMMRRMMVHLQSLDEVSSDHWIGLQLLYKDSTPQTFQPKGFHE